MVGTPLMPMKLVDRYLFLLYDIDDLKPVLIFVQTGGDLDFFIYESYFNHHPIILNTDPANILEKFC